MHPIVVKGDKTCLKNPTKPIRIKNIPKVV
jgi:hypothetical protein